MERNMSKNNNDINSPDLPASEISRKLSTSEKLVQVVADVVVPDRNVPKTERLKLLTNEQKSQLQEIEDNAIINFSGSIDELESALGMLRVGHHLGWRVLYIAHSKKTIRKYEEILDIKIREIFYESGPSTKRSIGLALAEKFSNFWRLVSGDIKIDNKKIIE
jgi:hypothetical protein